MASWDKMIYQYRYKILIYSKFRRTLVPVDYIWATTRDFQQCGILTSVDSDEPVQPHF